jgi:hypothetical protein
MRASFAKLAAIAVAGIVYVSVATAQAGVIAQWSFETPSDVVASPVNNPAPSLGSGTAASIGMDGTPTPNPGVTTDDVLAGKTSDTGANGVANLSQIWRVRASAGTAGAANGWYSGAAIGTQGAQFYTSTVGYSSPINVSFDWYATTQGEANLQLEYTTGGGTWHNVAISFSGSGSAGLQALTNSTDPNIVLGSYVSDNLLTGGTLAGQDWFTGLTATINDPAAANNPNFAIEMVNASSGTACVSTQGTALNNSSGNWRFDNITISAAAVPEPSTIAMLAVGALGAATYYRRRRSPLQSKASRSQ